MSCVDAYTIRCCRLGHMCQGLYPSPLDRLRGAKFAAVAADFLATEMKKGGNAVMVVGLRKGTIVLSVGSIFPLSSPS